VELCSKAAAAGNFPRPKGGGQESRLTSGVAFLKHFLEDLARTVLVAHFLVGLGKVELGLNVIPTIILARG